MNTDLDNILRYNMTPDEAKAFKICVMWNDIAQEEFPNEFFIKLAKSGDPRKCLLFKYAYKMAKELTIPDQEYRLYIRAQLQILKSIDNGEVHARIGPECLVGDKAWRRWKLWKSRFDQICKKRVIPTVVITANDTKIKSDIDRTKDFLFKQFQGQPTPEGIARSVKERLMVSWLVLNKVSAYYGLMSPYLKLALGGKKIEEILKFDLNIYKPSLKPEIETYFKEVFAYEFAK